MKPKAPHPTDDHQVYIANLQRQLDECRAAAGGTIHPYDTIAEKFMLLDLSPLREYLEGLYPSIGRPAKWSPILMLRSLLAFKASNIHSITVWVTETRLNPMARALCGFTDKTAGVGTYYGFSGRLWNNTHRNLCKDPEGIRHPKRRPNAPKHKGEKADSVEDITVGQLIESLLSDECATGLLPATTLNVIFDFFRDMSAEHGLINKDALCLAGDGTSLETAAQERKKRVPNPEHPELDGIPSSQLSDEDYFKLLYKYSQPDCDIGYDSYHNRFFFGANIYVLSDCDSGLPIYFEMFPASRHDSMCFAETFVHFIKTHPDYHVCRFVGDSAHDAMDIYRFLHGIGCQTLIDLNPRTGVSPMEPRDGYTFQDDGTPICPAGVPMRRNGLNKTRMTMQYRCGKMLGTTCNCATPCSNARYGKTYAVPLDDNPRIHTDPPRNSAEYTNGYKRRTTVERSHQNAKNGHRVRHAAHRSTNLWWLLEVLAMALAHLTAVSRKVHAGSGDP